ncbi:DUF2199 domain-containing protein [Micromonospora sp. NPDC005215]|uniref:DUF2199 domain-containing protein n=1 Tax=Micromonospora sp. NPDC005215 TaxID=3157024 RepID=UPI0033BBB035
MSEPCVTCSCCGTPLDPEHAAVNFELPDEIAGIDDDEFQRLVDTHTYVVLTVRGHGSYLRVILPIRIDDGRTATFGVWVAVSEEDFYRVRDTWASESYSSLRFTGLLTNAIQPWGDQIVGARVEIAVIYPDAIPHVVSSSQPLLREVLQRPQPTQDVLAPNGGAYVQLFEEVPPLVRVWRWLMGHGWGPAVQPVGPLERHGPDDHKTLKGS